MANSNRVSALMGLFISYPLVREHSLVQHVLSHREGKSRIS